MLETIYTIPVNAAFDECAADHALGCPFCRLRAKLEDEALEATLGASVMEPDVRIRTNEQGFCRRHLEEMATRKNRLGLALMLESHLDELRGDLTEGAFSALTGARGKKSCERVARLEQSCFVCERVGRELAHMLENAAALWEEQREFRDKLKAQPYFCLPHFRAFAETARGCVSKKLFPDFWSDLSAVTLSYMDGLRDDVSLFVKKFDYRYDCVPWGNAKTAIERAAAFLGGDR